MVGVHVGHDCIVGDHVIMANNATLGGHVVLGDFVIMGGLSAAHQNTRIGRHAFVGGMAGINHDVIPFGNVWGNHAHLEGLNLVGLKRRGFSREAINTLRAAYRMLFAEEGTFQERLDDTADAYRQLPRGHGDRGVHSRRRQPAAHHAAAGRSRSTGPCEAGPHRRRRHPAGQLWRAIASAIGRPLFVLRLTGFARPGAEPFDGVDLGIAQLGAAIEALGSLGAQSVCMAGIGRQRPNLSILKPDAPRPGRLARRVAAAAQRRRRPAALLVWPSSRGRVSLAKAHTR